MTVIINIKTANFLVLQSTLFSFYSLKSLENILCNYCGIRIQIRLQNIFKFFIINLVLQFSFSIFQIQWRICKMRRNKNNGNKVRYFFNSDRNSWRIHQKNKAKRGIMILIGSLLTLAVLPAITHGFVIAPPWANPVINPCSGTSWQLIYWPPDGRCYQIFEKGPCPDTQELAFHAVSKRVSILHLKEHEEEP